MSPIRPMKPTRIWNPERSLDEDHGFRRKFLRKNLRTADPIRRPLRSGPGHHFMLRASGIVLAGSAFVAVCAHIALPLYFTPVPLSSAPFAVLSAGLRCPRAWPLPPFALTWLKAPWACRSSAPTPLSPGGLTHLLGPTGGYLLAYPFAAALISLSYGAAPAGDLPLPPSAPPPATRILLCGALGSQSFTHASPRPLRAGRVSLPARRRVKIVAAAALAVGFQRLRRPTPSRISWPILFASLKGSLHTVSTNQAESAGQIIDISIAHSPDSDDAFMFYGLATNKVRVPGYRFTHTLCDIETLNLRALR